MAFGSDMSAKSISLLLPRIDHMLLIALLYRHFVVSSSLSGGDAVGGRVAETAYRDSGYDPAAGILLRDSTCLRLVQQGSQLTCACSVQTRVISGYWQCCQGLTLLLIHQPAKEKAVSPCADT